ncbi:MAG: SGNH/GDSL hydrolase family protein [Bacteroidia bacterium]|nr:SGNH/GDSL hydrolase family protein [Bacteroidia bacterium]
MKIAKVVGINVLILTVLLTVVELFFGGWLIERNVLENYNIVYSKTYHFDVSKIYPEGGNVTYTRDKYGLRMSGKSEPGFAEILTVGGSTTDQRYLSDGLTWQDAMHAELSKSGLQLTIANAGIDGQSTFGHLKNFEIWFPLIPELKPKYVMFYIGINDFYIDAEKWAEITDIENTGFKSEIKNKSVIYNTVRKIKGALNSRVVRVSHSKIDFSKLTYTTKPLLDSSRYRSILGERLTGYKARIEKLALLAQKMGAVPVFISQPCRKYRILDNGTIEGTTETENYGDVKLNGVDYFYMLSIMNEMIKQVCEEGHYPFIEFTPKTIWADSDFYDYVHTTPSGAKKVGIEMAKSMLPILKP